MLLTKAWKAYKAEKRIEGFSPHTINAYRLQANLLVRHFEDIDTHSISTQGIKDYLATSSEGLKPSSLAHRVRFIRSFFRWLHEEGHITANPAAKIIVILLFIYFPQSSRGLLTYPTVLISIAHIGV